MSPREDGYRAKGEDRVEVSLGSFPREGGTTQATEQSFLHSHSPAFVWYFGLHQEKYQRTVALAKPPLEG